MFIYNLILYIISPFLILKLIIEMLRRKGGLLYLFQRLGYGIKKTDKQVIWLHAASVGETKIALNIYKSLSGKFPEDKFIEFFLIALATSSKFNPYLLIAVSDSSIEISSFLFPNIFTTST